MPEFKTKTLFYLSCLLLIWIFAYQPVSAREFNGAPIYTAVIVEEYPHDTNDFTQGFVFLNDKIYEGTGLPGKSHLKIKKLETGDVLKSYKLPDEIFGEGIAVFGDKIYQLTYKSNVGFIYDLETFELLKEFYYATEGWGLTHDDEYLFMSDGTSKIYKLNPEDCKIIEEINVWDDGGEVIGLNELEYIDGKLYANVYPTDVIAIIDISSGQVTGWITCDKLIPTADRRNMDVLNGIAWDAENQRLLITGKFWPKVFEIEMAPTE